MSAGDTLRAVFRVAPKYRCEMSTTPSDMAAGRIGVAWSPCVPKRLTRAGWRDYRRGDDAFIAEAAGLLGINIMVAEETEAGDLAATVFDGRTGTHTDMIAKGEC